MRLPRPRPRMDAVRVHLTLTAAWVVLIVPTLLWWRESVFWISLMSIYAIVVSHVGAWQAARAERAASSDAEPGPPDRQP